ncbi:hypothetical protein [Merismopedia glauca]|uniref:hypothetical protein n=1 Tax=Merismopedia glauca TaxID=292586 RepID=UPI001C62B594|nr:hypothetical protein [Merismopedia glauca]
MPKGRPGGNPDLVKYQFSTDREEPCTAKMTLRLPPSQYARLREIDNWQERVREAIAHLLEQGQLDSSSLTLTEDAGRPEPASASRDGEQTPTSRT